MPGKTTHCWRVWQFYQESEWSNRQLGRSQPPWTVGLEDYIAWAGAKDTFDSKQALKPNTWYHLAVTFDGTQPKPQRGKIYINGELDVAGQGSKTEIPDGASSLYLGCLKANQTSYLHGLLDEVRIYRRALSESEIQALFRNPGSGPTDKLQAHWKLDQSHGSQIPDATGNHPGTYRSAFAASALRAHSK